MICAVMYDEFARNSRVSSFNNNRYIWEPMTPLLYVVDPNDLVGCPMMSFQPAYSRYCKFMSTFYNLIIIH